MRGLHFSRGFRATPLASAKTRGASLAAQLLNASRKQPVPQLAVFDLDELLRTLTPMLTYLVGQHVNRWFPVGRTAAPPLPRLHVAEP